jgi:hypothetical protein
MSFIWRRLTPEPAHPITLTRKDFFDLAYFCRSYAQELASLDQNRVNLRQCYKFNSWLSRIKRYDLLSHRLQNITWARPIARWQLLVLGLMFWLILWLALPGRLDRAFITLILNGMVFMLLALFFIPEGFYGGTVEMIEGKVLRVVVALEEILQRNELQVTEAVFFQAKETLEQAHLELRQQIDLAHRK